MNKMRILVAMSGGIDSSVVAHILKEQGHDVVGVRFTLWTDPLAPPIAQVLPSKCCDAQSIARAHRVAKNLGITLHILDLKEEFKRKVVDPFFNGCREGLTPNPCVGFNRTIKFGRLLEFADQLGCAKLATGHYARVSRRPACHPEEKAAKQLTSRRRARGAPQHDTLKEEYILLEAIDTAKDQSYYLYGLTQEQLSRVIFPLGTMFKRDVYELAKKFDIPYDEHSYRESQDLCFFPEKTPKAFLKRHLNDLLKPGPIVRKRNGETIGTHEGVPLYAIGQRRMGIGGQRIPIEVVQKDYSSNTLIVDTKGKTKIKELKINSINWVNEAPPPNLPHLLHARTHSTGQKHPGILNFQKKEGIFTFSCPIPPQSPGQHLVFYRGEGIIGGGVILCNPEPYF